jgi:hypothetical protein
MSSTNYCAPCNPHPLFQSTADSLSIFACPDNTINRAYGPDNACDATGNSSVNYMLGANVNAYAPTLRALDASFSATFGANPVAQAAASVGNASGIGYQSPAPLLNTLYSNDNPF